jgi:hypothetical protein
MTSKKKTTTPKPWNDTNFKILVTLEHLKTQKKILNAAIKKYVDPEDCYPSDALCNYLRDYPLDEASLDAISMVSPFDTLDILSLSPLFDGEEDPFPVNDWRDISKLKRLKTLSAGSVLPRPDDVKSHPSIQAITISVWGANDKRQDKAIVSFCAAAGFTIRAMIGDTATLRRGELVPAAEAVLQARELLRLNVQKAKKGGFQLDIDQVHLRDAQMSAEVRLWLRNAKGESLHNGIPPSQELLILSSKELSTDAEKKLKARAKELTDYILEHQRLPSS